MTYGWSVSRLKDDETLEILLIDEDEVNSRDSDMNVTEYLFHRAAEKANRLGKEKTKVVRTYWTQDGYTKLWNIYFVIKKDKWW